MASGTIPTNLGQLTRLSRLSLTRCPNLFGTIPSHIGALSRLSYLVLNGNQLSGSIPTQLTRLTNLFVLRLDKNQLTGSIPTQIGILRAMVLFTLDTNQLSGTIPSQIAAMTKLLPLALQRNRLTGSLPTEFGNFKSMNFFVLHSNLLAGTIPTEFGKLTSLIILSLDNNTLTGSIPSELGNLRGTSTLILANNRLHGPIPSQIDRLTELEHLDLSFNQLSGDFFPVPSKILINLLLHHNRISATIPPKISTASQLTTLTLFQNRIGGSVPPLSLAPDALVLLFDNVLSCSLPISNLTNSTTTLVALGNEFSIDGWNNRIDAASWLSPWDTDSVHLFVAYPRPWVRLVFLICCSVLGGMICVLIASFLGAAPWSAIRLNPFWICSLKLCLSMVGLSAVFVLVLAVSPTAHMCPSGLSRITLGETTRLDFIRCPLVIAFILAHVVFTVLGMVWLSRSTSSAIRPSTFHHLEAPLLSRVPNESNFSQIVQRIALVVGWLALIGVLNIPTIIYFMMDSFPANNTLGVSQGFVVALRRSISVLLVLINDVIIPSLSGFVVDSFYIKPSTRHHHATKRFELILLSQLVVLAVAPIFAQFLVHDHCLRLTRAFWGPCQPDEGAQAFDVTILFDHPTGPQNVTVLTQNEVCYINRFRIADPDLCVRGVIETTSKLNIYKLATQCLIMVIRTLLIFLFGLQAVPGWVPVQFRRVTSLLTPKTVSEVTMTQSIVSWIVVGLVYGAVAPLMWPIVLFAQGCCVLVTWFLGVLQRRRGVEIVSRGRLRVSWKPVWCGLVLQLLLVVWYLFVADLCE
eukprot:c10149_g1_i2.p1 GENE.c10149_g1_i2~~c10149_g1_i2.p1  ORF type:complete len:805 (+),score=156.65 c10149_g1_i2:169-2583(+)